MMSDAVGLWRVGIGADYEPFRVTADGEPVLRRLSVTEVTDSEPAGCVVELVHQVSSMMPHALLAARFAPAAGQHLQLTVVRGKAFDISDARYRGPLQRPVALGLPPDLAEAAAEGFVTSPNARPLPAGTVEVVGGGIDHDSSPYVFLRCGALLRVVLTSLARGENALESATRLMATW